MDVKDDKGQTDIPPSSGIDVRTSLRDNLATIREKCHLYSLEVPTSTLNAFCVALRVPILSMSIACR